MNSNKTLSIIQNILFSVVVISWIILAGVLIFNKGINSQNLISAAAVSAAASVIYGVVNTLHNSFIRRVNFIKDYLTPLHVNTELKGAFYELVYAYKDSAFQEINSIQLTNDQARELRGKPSAFFKMNPGELNDPAIRKAGKRFYHLYTMQDSEEETRLDSLLSYFSMLGYFYKQGMIQMKDIYGTVGYMIDVMDNRKCVRDYIRASTESDSTTATSGAPAFNDLQFLIDEVRVYRSIRTKEFEALKNKMRKK